MASSAVEANSSDECKDDDALNSSLRTCANEPDFAIICAFLEKFSKDLSIDLPNFKNLQEWLTNTDEVSEKIRELHIKLLRKTRKTVHEKSWESAVSKFCFTYSVQDAWEIERFGYKNSSLKVKLRVLRELLESQFERNAKFRANILGLSADSLRSQPIGRDRHGHSYWLTQDNDCNLRIYQEHLDEEIWQVVATNRDEFVTLIKRLRNNEVVLPSTDIGAVDEDSSSNSCNIAIEKPPPPEEIEDDSQEEEIKVPNLKIKLNGDNFETVKENENKIDSSNKDKKYNEKEKEKEKDPNKGEKIDKDKDKPKESNKEKDQRTEKPKEDPNLVKNKDNKSEEMDKKVKPLLISQSKLSGDLCSRTADSSASTASTTSVGSCKKRPLEDIDKSTPMQETQPNLKKVRPSLLDSKKDKKESKYGCEGKQRSGGSGSSNNKKDGEEVESENEDDDDEDDGDDEGEEEEDGEEEEEEEGEEDDDDEDDDEEEEEGEEEDVDSAAADTGENEDREIEDDDKGDDDEEEPIVGEAIEDPPVIVKGGGAGKDCNCPNSFVEPENHHFVFCDDFFDRSSDFVGEAIEEDTFYLKGDGFGEACLVGNTKAEEDEEPKAKFFFGQPGCLQLSPIKALNLINSKDNNGKEGAEEKEDFSKEKLAKSNDNDNKDEDEDSNKQTKSDLNEKLNAKEKQEKEKAEKAEKAEAEEFSKEKNQNGVGISKSQNNENEKQSTKEKDNEPEKAETSITNDSKTRDSDDKSKMEANDSLESKNGTPENSSSSSSSTTLKSLKDKNNEKIVASKLTTEDKNSDDKENPENIADTTLSILSEESEKNSSSKEKAELVQQSSLTSLPNRKRRLEDFEKPAQPSTKSLNSESEIDLASDQNLDDIDCSSTEIDIGGKRLKMRSKQIQSELRKKVECQKRVGNDETTSSSGEEDAQRRRKIIHPKKFIEKEVEKGSVDKTFVTPAVPKQNESGTSSKATESPLEEKSSSSSPEKAATAPSTAVSVGGLSVVTTSEESKSSLSSSTKVLSSSNLPAASRDFHLKKPMQKMFGKQKPSLEEIVERKLKKSPEKPEEKLMKVNDSPFPLPLPPATATPTSGPTTIVKKAPITKPLKKNLLTQLRQEESDEEAIPRKRVINETSKSPAAEAEPKENNSSLKKAPSPPKNEVIELKSEVADPSKKIKKEEKDTEKETSSNKLSADSVRKANSISSDDEHNQEKLSVLRTEIENKIVEKKSVDPKILERKTPERKTSDKQRKRRNSDEVNKPSESFESGFGNLKNSNEKVPKTVKEETSSTAEKVEKIDETLVKIKKEEVKKESSPIDEPIGRRSGRRNAALVVYAELPQPKRTKANAPAAKAPNKKESPVKNEKKPEEKLEENKSEEVTKNEVVTPKKKGGRPSKAALALKAKTQAEEKSETKEESKEEKPLVGAKASDGKSPSDTTAKAGGAGAGCRGGRKKLEVDTKNIIELADAEIPVRQSRRIAQQKIKEEAERRKLEEIALKTMKEELKKKKQAEKKLDPTVSIPSDESSSEASTVETKKKVKKKLPGKDGWSSGSEEQEEPEEEDEEPPHEYSDPGSPLFKSDHEFSPESDLEDESQIVPMKRARTARKEDAEDGEDVEEEEACQKCGKSDHPEWILLCDNCDKGYHCSCLSPVLFYIPEGNWYCPPCQQDQLIIALEKQLEQFDAMVERKKLEAEESKRLAEAAAIEEQKRLEIEKKLKEDKKLRKGKRSDRSGGDSDDFSGSDSGEERRLKSKHTRGGDSDDDDDDSRHTSASRSKKAYKEDKLSKRSRGDGRTRRRAAKRGDRRRRKNESNSDSDNGSGSDSESESSSTYSESDDEPIYKLRKRRQINVSYRLNEYDDLINSALKKEMDEVAGAGNLGRGKDISTIIEADKEVEARENKPSEVMADPNDDEIKGLEAKQQQRNKNRNDDDHDDDDDDDQPIKCKPRKRGLKKKSRKLTTLDISSEEDDASDEDFKTSSIEDDEEEDTSVSVSSNSDSSLEIYKRRRNRKGSSKKKQRKASRRAARERRKDKKFVVDDDSDDEPLRPRVKKKKKFDSDYTESETVDDISELSENLNSSDLCDDSTSDDSDGAWRPDKNSKKRKASTKVVPKASPKTKKVPPKKTKRLEYSDDDLTETEIEDDEDDDVPGSGKGSGKQPRSQPLKPAKPKGKPTPTKKKSSAEESDSESGDSTRRTRGRRYAYLEDFDDDSSDGGIKPGVKRPDTPPEERQKFIERQEEIKRMLAEKNAEGAKLAATPRLTPIKSASEKQTKSPAKTGAGDLSAIPLAVIRQAKVLDIDYYQRKGELDIADPVDDVDSEFGDADLTDDLPDMDEDTIARMVEEEEELTAAVSHDLSVQDNVLRITNKKAKEPEKPSVTPNPVAPSAPIQQQNPTPPVVTSGLQEPLRKRLPMPTMHPPLLRHQFLTHPDQMSPHHLMQRPPIQQPSMHLLHNALSAPIGQPLRGNFLGQQRMPSVSMPPRPSLGGAPQPSQPSQGSSAASGPSPLIQRPSLPPTMAPSTPSSAAAPLVQQPSGAGGEGVIENKPRGRRKKITPLRDPIQKQQAAAAATAAAVAAAAAAAAASKAENKSEIPNILGAVGSGSAKVSPKSTNLTTSSALNHPPPPSVAHFVPGGLGPEKPGSLITRMPHLTGSRPNVPPSSGPGNIYAPNDVGLYYGAGQRSLRPPAGSIPMTSHVGMRPTYGPPPLHANSGGPPPNGPPSSHRPNLPGQNNNVSPNPNTPLYRGGPPPPPARHSAPHLNPYRPPIFGNYPPLRGAVQNPSGSGIRPPPNVEYAHGPRGYPYGYYPPPPLTAPHHQHPHQTQHPPQTSQPPKSNEGLQEVQVPHAAGPSASLIPTAVPNVPTSVRPPTRASPPPRPPSGSSSSSLPSASPQPQKPSVIPASTNPKVSVSSVTSLINPKPPTLVTSDADKLEPRKKLTTLESFSTTTSNCSGESPLPLTSTESPNAASRDSPANVPDATEDSSSAPETNNPVTSINPPGETPASEFSGLVSYFSSQHDDYNS